jgi:undecaprenyl-diphosphatase
MPPQLYALLYGPDSLNCQLFAAINQAHHPLLDPLMQAMIFLGGSRTVYLYAAILLVVSLVNRELMPRRYVWVFCVATAGGILVEELLKGLFHVPRPALAIGLDKIRVLGDIKLKNSLPSGHAVFSFVLAQALSYRRSRAWKLPLYSFACLVAYSRVYVGAHYPLDVAVGALVGIGSGFCVWKGWEVGARLARGTAEGPRNGA